MNVDWLNIKHKPDYFKILKLIFILIGFLVFQPVLTSAEGLNDYAADLVPPQITVIYPLPDSAADTDIPKIEVSFADIGSGIDENTIRLVLNRLDVTSQSIVESIDVTGQAIIRTYKITYQPSAPLSLGSHEIRFSLRDLAGNLAELHWRFEVQGEGRAGFRIGGSNTYQFDSVPIYKNTDTWDLTAGGQFGENGVQLRLLGRITDYPGLTPNYNYEGYNFYYDHYLLTYQRKKFNLAMGRATASLSSELLQIGLALKGGVVNDAVDLPSGQLNWSVFSGKTGSTYGIGITAYDLTGLSGEWISASGWGFGGYYVGLGGGNNGFDYGGIKGNLLLGESVLFRYELINGYSRAENRFGNGMALHFDGMLATTALGFDYFMIQSEYPEPGSSSVLPTGGGMERYAIRSVTPFDNGQSINIGASVAVDNPQAKFTTRDNLSIGYNFNFDPDFHFSSLYQGDFQYNKSDLTNKSNRIAFDLRKSLEESSMNTSLSFEKTQRPDPSDSFDGIQLFGAWIKSIGGYDLTPSARWTYQYGLDKILATTIETRLTLSKQLHPDLSVSRIAFFHRKSEDEGEESPHLTNTGVEAALQLLLWYNSILTISGNYSEWVREPDASGRNTGFQLSWKIVF